MKLEIVPELQLREGQEKEIAGLLQRCFSTDFGGASFYTQRHHLRILARKDDRLVGHMGLLYRAVRVDGRLVNIAGLAEVATDAEYRGQGIASQMLNAAIGCAKQTDAAFFLLFGTAGLYAAHGFTAVKNPVLCVTMDGARTGQIERQTTHSLMVLPLTDAPWDVAAEIDLLGAKF